MSHRKFLLCLCGIIAAGMAYRNWSASPDRLPVEDLLTRGAALQRDDQHEEAIRVFTVAVEKDPLNPEALAGRAYSYTVTLEGERALQDLEGAIRVSHGKHRKSFLLRAFILHVAGFYEEALADANHAIALDQTMADGYLMRSKVYQTPQKGNPAKAKQDFEKAVALAPEYKNLEAPLALGQ